MLLGNHVDEFEKYIYFFSFRLVLSAGKSARVWTTNRINRLSTKLADAVLMLRIS